MIPYQIIYSVVLCIMVVVLWEFTPIRRYSYIVMSKSISLISRFKIRSQNRAFRRVLHIIQICSDFFIFWMIFEWKDGCVANYLKANGLKIWNYSKYIGAEIVGFFEMMISALIFISPFGRQIAKQEDFFYCLVICSICELIIVSIFMGMLINDGITIPYAVLFIATCFGIWYVDFGICHLIVKIPVYFKVLSAIASGLIGISLPFAVAIILVSVISSKKKSDFDIGNNLQEIDLDIGGNLEEIDFEEELRRHLHDL